MSGVTVEQLAAALQDAYRLLEALPHEDEAGAPAEQQRRWSLRQRVRSAASGIDRAKARLAKIDREAEALAPLPARWVGVEVHLAAQLEEARRLADEHRNDLHRRKVVDRIRGAIRMVEDDTWTADLAIPIELGDAFAAAGLSQATALTRGQIEARLGKLERQRVEVVADAAGHLAALERLRAEHGEVAA